MGEEERRECVAPAWQFLKGRVRDPGAGQKVAYRRRAGRAMARSSLSMLSVRPLWAPIGPY